MIYLSDPCLLRAALLISKEDALRDTTIRSAHPPRPAGETERPLPPPAKTPIFVEAFRSAPRDFFRVRSRPAPQITLG